MPSTKLSPASKPAKAPSLKQRAARARDGLLRLAPRPAMPSPLPEPGSPEALAAFGTACRTFDLATHLSEEEYAALRIGDSHTLWTPERVREALAGDFSWFGTREMAGARSVTREQLEDLLVLTLRRDLRFAEAERRSGFKVLAALAHPGAEDEPEPAPGGDPAFEMIAVHRAAYAAWKPLGDMVMELTTDTPEYKAAVADEIELVRLEGEAFGNVITVRPTTLAGLRALAGYIPEAVRVNACSEPDDDAVLALRAMCNGVLALVPVETEDAELVSLGHDLDAAHAVWRAAEDVAEEPISRRKLAEAAILARPDHTTAELMATYHLPGVNEAHNAATDAFTALDPICAAIWKIPAHTPLGLAVKARAALVLMFSGGNYEEDAALGGDEEMVPENARRLIEACCALAGVTWKGEPIGGAEVRTPRVPADRAMPPERVIAAGLDLRAMTLKELASAHDAAVMVKNVAHAVACQPRCDSGKPYPASAHNVVGDFMLWLAEALTVVEDDALKEMRGRVPADGFEADRRLQVLAEATVSNGDPAETRAFVRDLLATVRD